MSNYTPDKNKNQENPELTKVTNKKIRTNSLLEYAVNTMSPGNVDRLKECGVFMSFLANEDLSKRKVHGANYCNNRFCPMCAWRQAKKDAFKIDVLMRYVETGLKRSYAFIFLNLTIINVAGEDLGDALDGLNIAFQRLVKLDEVKAVNKGYIRKLEITYSEKRGDYHPHFHVIMAVNKSYFKDKTYINQKRWLELWQQSMRDPDITQVRVSRVKRDNVGKIQNELAKYVAKDSDMAISQEVFDTFYKSLKGRQVLTFNGLFTQANKLYKLGELDHYKELDQTEYVYLLLYAWGKGEYIETEKRQLTLDEIKKYNRQLIDEKEVDD